MANPRQRRKAKSGSSTKPSASAKRGMQKKLVRAPTIKGAKVIQDNWDPKLTVRQNYQKLGLIGNLSMRDTGGKEKDYSLQGAKAIPESVKVASKKKQGMAKVQRDAEGNIVLAEEPEERIAETAWGPVLNSDDENEAIDGNDDIEEEGSDSEEIVEPNRDVTDTLEALSKTIAPVPRFTSQAEQSWLHRLVSKHGSNTAAMAHDRVDNIWQKTEGEIKRAIKKAGGIANLQD